MGRVIRVTTRSLALIARPYYSDLQVPFHHLH